MTAEFSKLIRCQASIVLERFRDLITTDRQLTVPAIGALGDFPLTDAQKRLVLEMTLEAVAVVEGDDVPAVVRTLMASMTKGTASSSHSVPRFFALSVASVDQTRARPSWRRYGRRRRTWPVKRTRPCCWRSF